jgi:hypothetical protein
MRISQAQARRLTTEIRDALARMENDSILLKPWHQREIYEALLRIEPKRKGTGQ